MFAIIEVAIGVVFVYLVLAMLVAAANEVVATTLGWRASTLEQAIAGLLGEDGRAPGPRTRAFYAHPLIRALSGTRKPSYIPAETFARVAPEVVRDAGAGQDPHAESRGSAVGFTVAQDGTVDTEALETLFEATMDRAVGWYKRKLQIVTIAVGAAVVVLANADTIRIANTLWLTPTLRTSVVEAAERRVELPPPTDPSVIEANYLGTDPMPSAEEINAEELGALEDRNRLAAEERELLDLLIGWGPDYRAVNGTYCATLQAERDRVCAAGIEDAACRAVLDRIAGEHRCEVAGTRLAGSVAFPGAGFLATGLAPIAAGHVFGWFMTLAAITLGAPLWFDLLKGLLNIRGAGKVPKAPSAPAPAGGGQ
jgi:hypothetical protein